MIGFVIYMVTLLGAFFIGRYSQRWALPGITYQAANSTTAPAGLLADGCRPQGDQTWRLPLADRVWEVVERVDGEHFIRVTRALQLVAHPEDNLPFESLVIIVPLLLSLALTRCCTRFPQCCLSSSLTSSRPQTSCRGSFSAFHLVQARRERSRSLGSRPASCGLSGETERRTRAAIAIQRWLRRTFWPALRGRRLHPHKDTLPRLPSRCVGYSRSSRQSEPDQAAPPQDVPEGGSKANAETGDSPPEDVGDDSLADCRLPLTCTTAELVTKMTAPHGVEDNADNRTEFLWPIELEYTSTNDVSPQSEGDGSAPKKLNGMCRLVSLGATNSKKCFNTHDNPFREQWAELESALQLRSVVQQVGLTVAVAEAALEFEHRALTAPHVLVRATQDRTAHFHLMNNDVWVKLHGFETKIIDFATSRLCQDTGSAPVYVDLGKVPEQKKIAIGERFALVEAEIRFHFANTASSFQTRRVPVPPIHECHLPPRTNSWNPRRVRTDLRQFVFLDDHEEDAAWREIQLWSREIAGCNSAKDFVVARILQTTSVNGNSF
ncbi:hypothetical protein HPB48_005930 [Haemaphysalis longicornis]|uniref:Uncharacterized protein n=1 Tax=Haemaphysalis longicornis TaxID=44386 RepID=A0A9J6FMN6_HAELO|nr:hypothetical protein HPB48_005930 [Haemaphysalis longicornis]